jgi:CHAT domain-containing protein
MKYLKNVGFWSLFLISIYFIVCIIHLSWFIANPEGFWGFSVFLDIIRIIFQIIVFLALFVFGFFLLIDSVIKLFNKKLKLKNLLIGIGLSFICVIILLSNTFFSQGVSLIFNSKMSEKYSYLENSKELIESGQIDEAILTARKSYFKKKIHNINPLFFLTKMWSISYYSKKNSLLSNFEATINYAYCQQLKYGNSKYAENLYKEAISNLDDKIFSKTEKNTRSFYANLSLSNIKFEQKKYDSADRYINKALNSSVILDKKDIEYIQQSYYLMLDRASRYGDWHRQRKICYELISLRKKAEMSLENKTHLEILQLLISTELLLENYPKVSKLIKLAEPIAEKYSDKDIYKTFQINKTNYFLALADRNQKDNSFKKPNNFWSIMFSKDEKKITNKESSLTLAQNSIYEIIDLSLKPKEVYYNNYELVSYLTYYKLILIQGNYKKAIKTLKLISKYIDPNLNNFLSEEIKFTLVLWESNVNLKKKKKLEFMINEKFYDFCNQFALLNDIDRDNLLLKFEKNLDKINYHYLHNKNPQDIENILNNSIKIKELSIISQIQISQLFKNQKNQKIIFYQSLSNEYRKLQNSYSFENKVKLERVRNKLSILHQELKISKVIMNGLNMNITWKDIKSKLTKQELAIEIIRVPNKYDSGVIYYAIIFSSNHSKPHLVKLFYESELEEILNCPGNTKERIKCILENKSEKLYDLIFKPISTFLVDKDIVYISKTGLLHAVPLGSITINNNWVLKSVSSLKSILSDKINFRSEGIELFGGANFKGFNKVQRNYRNQVSYEVEEKLQNEKITNLEHSKNEVVKIKKLYESRGIKNKIYTNDNANEYLFRKLSGKKNDIIHVATHGFSEGLSYNVNSSFSQFNNTSTELMRSGIILSPHSALEKLSDHNDGLITAMDLSELDLSNYNLAIFSSCESGLGNLYGNQGVYGIIRGLKLAGVKSMILSLWQVPDKQTSELMIAFYKHYLNGEHPIKALKNAKIELKKLYPNPYYWAGFEYFE